MAQKENIQKKNKNKKKQKKEKKKKYKNTENTKKKSFSVINHFFLLGGCPKFPFFDNLAQKARTQKTLSK